MKKVLYYSVLSLAIALGTSSMANADPGNGNAYGHHKHDDDQAPEIDGGLALSGLTLLGGTLTVLRSRRRK